jgi:predicted GIY-YIG superfamily endonuclease
MKRNFNEKRWRYIYIIELESAFENKNFYNKSKVYYTGTTANIGKRLGDHIFRRGKGFTNTVWKDARRTPVHIEYFFGNEWGAMKRERTIKNMSRERKVKLINSDKNMLLGYKFAKHMIIKKRNFDGELVINII